MVEDPAWTTAVTAVLVHPTEPAVWLHSGTIPALRFSHNDYLWFPDITPVTDAMRAHWDIDAIVLRCTEREVDRDRHHQHLTFLLQPQSPTMPPSGRWAPSASLTLSADPTHDALRTDLSVIDAPPGPTRRPWTARGWFEDAVAWSSAALHAAGLQQLAPPRQIRTWGLSTVIRFDTSAGAVFFKSAAFVGESTTAPALLFANEAALLSALSERLPAHLPCPLATDPERVWMLLPDAGPQLRDSADLDLWEATLRTHARFQRSFVGHTDDLMRDGCLDRRLPRLSAQTRRLLQPAEPLLALLDETDRHRLLSSAATLQTLIAELAALAIPDTVVHGDLHAGNVGLRDNRPIFFDWTDACVSHPFLDLLTFFADGFDTLEAIPGARDRLIAAYLDEWRGLAPAAALRRAVELIQPVGMLHHAISYQHMLPTLAEPDLTSMAGGGLFWLRALLAHLAAAPPQ